MTPLCVVKMEKFNGKSVDTYISERLAFLTALEVRVISAMVGRRSIDAQTQLKVVAAEANVSEAMVTKIAKKLGFDGFRSLRTALAEYNRIPVTEIRQELCGYPTTRDIVKKIVRTLAKALEETSSSLFRESLERATQCFCSARQRDFYGAGGSAQVARDAANKFLRIGMRASVFDDGCMMSISASLLQEEDVVVAFSYSGQNLPVLDAVRQARKNGAKVIAITNRLTSKLTKESDFALCVAADDSPLGGEHGAARTVQLSIVDALFMAVAQRNPAATETNLSRTMLAARTHEERW